MSYTRRRLLQMGGAVAGLWAAAGRALPAGAPVAGTPAAAGPGPAARGAGPEAKRISLVNLHTGEKLQAQFFNDGAYAAAALASIAVLLRDVRSGEQHVIDPGLMDYLYEVAQHLGTNPAFSVISGYRSPQTNARLRKRGHGVAQHSLHMEGRAIDVRLAGVDCANLAAGARELARGGVGYYRSSDFVHLDTGRFRAWNG